MDLAEGNDEFFLDVVDGALQFHGREHMGERLIRVLGTAGSVWTVAEDYKGLVRVVTDEVQVTCGVATSVADGITAELREAWTNAFGRNGDPSDAWDHAIKAVESVLIPTIMPKNAKATLGSVLGELRSQGQMWKFILPGKDADFAVAPLLGLLEAVWPNVDRHGGAASPRTPTEREARAVVTLAATIVQWHREGGVLQRR